MQQINRGRAIGVAICLMSLLSPSGARAQTVLFSNFGPGDTFSASTYGWGPESSQTAAFFVPATDGVATQVDFPAIIVDQGTATDEIPVGIYANVGGVPGGPVLSKGFTFHLSPGLTPAYRTASISPVFLSSAQSYYFIIGPFVEGYIARGGWFANNIGGLGMADMFVNPVWTAHPDLPTPALRIAAAPEPCSVTFATFGLLVAGLSALKQCRRSRREMKTEASP